MREGDRRNFYLSSKFETTKNSFQRLCCLSCKQTKIFGFQWNQKFFKCVLFNACMQVHHVITYISTILILSSHRENEKGEERNDLFIYIRMFTCRYLHRSSVIVNFRKPWHNGTQDTRNKIRCKYDKYTAWSTIFDRAFALAYVKLSKD